MVISATEESQLEGDIASLRAKMALAKERQEKKGKNRAKMDELHKKEHAKEEFKALEENFPIKQELVQKEGRMIASIRQEQEDNDIILAVNTAVYLHNWSPTSALKNKTLFESWSGKKPNVSNLKVFGCICFVHTPDHLRKKLGPKSCKAIFVGYPLESKVYEINNTKKSIDNSMAL